jgi:hypothetical protein
MDQPGSDELFTSNEVTDPADYESDFILWIDKQVELLRAKKFEQLDLLNVVEEFDALAKSLRRELSSRLRVLLLHLLKCQYQPENTSGSWLGTITEQRSEIASLLEQNPSLKREVSQRAQRSYSAALHGASVETGLPESTFPSDSPYTAEQLLDPRFFP